MFKYQRYLFKYVFYREFCQSIEQGTVWDNTYEEHDSSLKGSFATDQSTTANSKKNASKISSEDNHLDTGIETSSNSSDLTNDQPCISTINVYEDDKDNDLNFTNPVDYIEKFNQELPLGQTILPNVSQSTPDIVTLYIDKDKENCTSNICNEYYPKMHISKVNSELDKTCIQDVSMEFTTVMSETLIPMYCDVTDNKQEDVQKDVSHQYNFDTDCTMEKTKVALWGNKAETANILTSKQQEHVYEKRDINNSFTFTEKTKLLHKSMDITEAVSVPLCKEKVYNIEHATESLISNCNNDLMEITQAVPISVKSIKSHEETFRKVPVIVQNCKDAKCSILNNSMVLSTNLQLTKNVVSSQIHDANCSRSHLAQDSSMKLTSVVQSLVADADILNMNNDGNNAGFNTSMEMTTALSSKIYEKNTTYSCNKSTNNGNNLRKSLENTEHTNKTEIFNNVPMEITRPVNLYGRNVPHFSENIEKSLWQNQETNNSGETELFSNTPMQMTRSINVMLPASAYDEENLRIDESMFRDDRNTSLYMSMEITKAVSPKNREEISNPIKNECEKKSTNNLMTSDEKTKLLCKFMDITETIPDSLLHEKICNIENTRKLTEAMISDTVITPRIHSPGENFAGSVLQTYSALNNDEPINASMEITTAIQPIMHDMENITFNGMKNLDVFKTDEFQCPIINNVTESKKNETKENITISGKTVEATNFQNTSSDTHVLIDNYDNSSDVILTNSNRKRPTCENENINMKKFRSDSLAESKPSICNNAHSSSRIDDKYISNERLIKDKTDPTRISTLSYESNSNDSLNKIDEYSFLRKNLENSLVELQSINPPSFVDMSSEEENSFHEVAQENKLDTSITTDGVLINNNSSERLERMNIENEKIKDCHKSVVTDTIKNDRRTDRQAIERTIIDDFQTDKPNRYTTDVEQLKGEDVLSASNVSYRKTMTLSSTDHLTKINITREDQVDEEEYTQEEINNKVEVRNIEQKKQCSEIEEEKECYINHLKEAQATIKDQVNKIKNQDEYCQENSDDKVNPQGVEQKEYCLEQKPDAEQDVNRIEEAESLVVQDPFLSLTQKLEEYAERYMYEIFHLRYYVSFL